MFVPMTQQRSDLVVGRRTSLVGLGSLVGTAAIGGSIGAAVSAAANVAQAQAGGAMEAVTGEAVTGLEAAVDRNAGYEALYPITGISHRERIERAHGLTAAGSEVREVLGTLADGGSFRGADGALWFVEAAYEPRGGALPVVLGARSGLGVRVSLEVFLDDPSAAVHPPARAMGLSAFVTNGGDGTTATREQQGLAAMAFLGAIAERASGSTLRARLSTHAARSAAIVAV
jgi:hypothetical protein